MEIMVVGCGYVGLVTGACFAEMGHQVTCVDVDREKIARLKQGKIPFFEPGLKELVERNQAAERLFFTDNYKDAVSRCSVCFIAVATPSTPDGGCDVQYVLQATTSIAQEMHKYMVFVIKSTAQIGTAKEVEQRVRDILEKRNAPIPFDVVVNPEFLKEGSAVSDCMKPDRIVLGVQSPKAEQIMREIYSAFTLNHDRILIMDPSSAEMTKYAANAMLATRISLMNQLAEMCEKVGANIHAVRVGIGSDARIGYQFLYPGVGFGGSCFPKDLRALIATAKKHACDTSLLEAVYSINDKQKKIIIKKLTSYFSSLKGKTIAIWGLSFKPDTDDVREAPALALIEQLLAEGATLRVYDPVAISSAKRSIKSSEKITWCQDEYMAAEGADAIALMTEWKQFRFIDMERVLKTMRGTGFFDGRNQYKAQEMRKKGFNYFGIGVT